MEFKVKGTELNSILSTVIKGFNQKEDNSYIAFELDEMNGKLIITSRSRATYFRGSLNASAIEISPDEPTVYHLDGIKLKQLASILPSSPVDIAFEINDNTRSFTIKTMVSKYKLPVLSETPLAPVPTYKEWATVDANELMTAVKDLIKIVSTDPATQEHQSSCMHFNIGENKMKLSATDSYALGSIKIDSTRETLVDDADVLVRHAELSTLVGSFDSNEMLTLVGSKEMFGYTDENGTVSLVGIINIDPLNTSGVEAATKSDNTFVVDKGELKSALDTLSKLSPTDETVDITLTKGQDEIRVSNRYGDYVDVVLKNFKFDSPGKASFATSILTKAINPAGGTNIRLEFGDLSLKGVVRIVSLKADGTADDNVSLIATRMDT